MLNVQLTISPLTYPSPRPAVWAFEKLADKRWGVIGMRYRPVPCNYSPAVVAPSPASPSPGQAPPSGAKNPHRGWNWQEYGDNAGGWWRLGEGIGVGQRGHSSTLAGCRYIKYCRRVCQQISTCVLILLKNVACLLPARRQSARSGPPSPIICGSMDPRRAGA